MPHNNRELYRRLCERELSIPLFSRDWWLDTVCGEGHWDVAVVRKNDDIVAAMPYYIKRRLGFTLLTQPRLTQTMGPWMRQSAGKYQKVLASQKDFMGSLIDQLPRYDHFSQNWHYSQTNWLPFYWRGFLQTTRYTYVLTDLSDETKLWSNLQENIRTDIRKASNRFSLRIRDDIDVASFLRLNRLTFLRQGKEPPYTEALVHRLDRACAARNCRKIFIAEDKEGRQHAGVYIVWDENSAYYLLGGGDPDLRSSGATSLCMWEAIRFAARVTTRFDFEGSMIESVERFFRAFGTMQIPYFNVSRTPSYLLRLRHYFMSLRNAA